MSNYLISLHHPTFGLTLFKDGFTGNHRLDEHCLDVIPWGFPPHIAGNVSRPYFSRGSRYSRWENREGVQHHHRCSCCVHGSVHWRPACHCTTGYARGNRSNRIQELQIVSHMESGICTIIHHTRNFHLCRAGDWHRLHNSPSLGLYFPNSGTFSDDCSPSFGNRISCKIVAM